ncbi:DUF6200 domain-containing protein [Marinivivus vitaminiproducens]|uniref:DUF6200 domain-containing protein n=1 Tax=Marinivivus vitaminiproducens TaxID=3035935 RepID=UPI0027A8AFE9|nr:hypothetical protein P4R82_18835 [Geminicoccaceae bacterium SCSIO 64248]
MERASGAHVMPSANATETVTATKKEAPAEVEAISELCVVDLGEHSRRAVKKLRRGEGRLTDKVEDAILSLREEGIIGANAQAVVVVVREESRLDEMFDYDDDDDDDDDDD